MDWRERAAHEADTFDLSAGEFEGELRTVRKPKMPPKFSWDLRTYSRLTLVHLPRWPLPRKGGLPLYALGELGERLKALRRVQQTGVEVCQLLTVAVIPAWHLPQLRRRYPTAVYHNGDRAAYLVVGAPREARLRDVIEAEEAVERAGRLREAA